MTLPSLPADADQFSEALFTQMLQVNPGLSELALYEFRYALDRLTPREGWASIEPVDPDALLARIREKSFYSQVQMKPVCAGRIVLDETVVRLTRTLMAGLVSGAYPPDWIRRYFYFDIRGFLFFVRSTYFSEAVRAHLGGSPYLQLEPGQDRFERVQDIGYREFQQANSAIDQAFVDAIRGLMASRGVPFLLTLVGPSAAGKTEIVARLREEFSQEGKRLSTIEMDHFMKDREYRDQCVMGPDVMHFELFRQSMSQILAGRPASIPRYDFLQGRSSHDLNGQLRAGQTPIQIEPADIIFLEGNFPFHHPLIRLLVGIKAMYLTDDPIRLKRKWKRDIDYRKKYDPVYFCNRYFRTQNLRAGEIYRPALEVCDLVVDTTAAALWATPEITQELAHAKEQKGKTTQ